MISTPFRWRMAAAALASLLLAPWPAHAAITPISSLLELNSLAHSAANGVFSGVAFDDKHHVYLRVWENSRQVYGVFIGDDGIAKGDVFPIGQAMQSFAGAPRVAYSSGTADDVFLVMFHSDYSRYDAGKTVFGQLIRYVGGGGSGAQFVLPQTPVVGTNFALSGSSLVPTFIQTTGDVVWNPTRRQFLTVWDDSRGGYDVFASLVTPAGVLPVMDANISAAPQAQGAPSAAYDSAHDRYLVVYQGLHPQSPAFPEQVGSWAKLVSAADLSIIHSERPNYGLIEVMAGSLALEVNTVYLPQRQAFLSYWTAFGSGARDVVGRIVPWNYGDAGTDFPTGVYPIHAMSFNEGAADAEYNPVTGTVLVPASSDAKVARGIELDANGIPTAASYNLTTPVPINGTFFPKVAIGDGGRFAVSFITDYTSAWLERFQGAGGGGGTPPPAPPPAAAPLAVTGLPASVTLPTTEGTAITWTAMTSGGTAPIQYQFMRYTDGVGWSVAQAYSSNNTYTWFPSAGTHALQVWVRSSGSTAAYDAYLGTDMFTVLPPAAKVMSLSSSMASPVPLNVPVSFTATASGGSVQYKFLMYTAANGWTVGQEYSGTKSFTWYPPVGLNAVQVWVRTTGSTAAYQDWKSTGMFSVAVAPVKLSGLVSNTPSTAPPSFTQTWTAYASGGPGALEYKFLHFDVGANAWSVLRDWSTNNQASWTPGTADSGWHSLQVWVRSVGSSVAWEDWRSSDYFLVTASGALTLTPNRSLNGMRVGDLVTFTATVIGGTGPWEYKFLTFDGTTWKLLQGYSSQNTFWWFPPAGTCAVQVWIRAAGSHAYWERFQSTGYFVVNP